MTEFKVGDRVRLVGDSWADADVGFQEGTVHEVVEVPSPQDALIEGGWYILPEDGWGAELVSGNSEEAISNRANTRLLYAGDDPVAIQFTPDSKNLNFEDNVRRHTDRIANILIEKNKAYGDSALNPVRVFSKADREEQLYVRIDDKISRIQRGTDFANEDTIDDLIGYLLLLKIAKESA